MPRGLEKLKSLQTLPYFVVGKDKGGCLLNGLNGLTDLGGSLTIFNLENVKNGREESKEANLKTKKKLQSLQLVWKEAVEDDIARAAVGFEVLENLEPPSALKSLCIQGYVGTGFPRWMMELSSSSSLVEIRFSECRKCERLPSFSHLPSLKVLELRSLDGLECIEGRREENQEYWFPSLTRLVIENCGNLESWFAMEAQEQVLSLPISFPSLVELSIKNCPKLKNMPLKLPSVIQTLTLHSTNAEFVQSLVLSPNSSSLVMISLDSCRKCKRLFPLGDLPSLKVLELRYMDGLECIEGRPEENHNKESWFPSLTNLEIIDCRNLESLFAMEAQEQVLSLPISFPSLVELCIRYCPKLKNMPLKLSSVIQTLTLHATNAEFVQSLVLSPNSSSLVKISLGGCRKCKRLPSFSHLPSLKVLELSSLDGLECIQGRPEENHNKESREFPSLTRLDIRNCGNLESWFAMEAQEQVLSLPISFPSLVELYITSCPKLKNMPLKLPSVIERLVLLSTNAELVQSLVLSPNSSLYRLAIQKCEGLESWPNWLGPHLTSLRELYIGCTPTLLVSVQVVASQMSAWPSIFVLFCF